MELIITLIVAVLIFSLLWYAISIVPFPPPLVNLRWLLFILLILVAVLWLWRTFMGGAAF